MKLVFLFISLFLAAHANAQTHALVQGWNLEGNDHGAAVDPNAVFGNATTPTSVSPSVTTVWVWDKNALKWNFFAPGMTPAALAAYAASKGYGVLATIPQGQGFWVNAKNSVTLDFAVSTGVAVPVVTLTATPSSIANGATSTLDWTSTNSDSCASSGGGGTGTTGSFTTPSLSATTTYTVTCTGAGGTASQSTAVTVAAAAAPTGYVSQGGMTWMPVSMSTYSYAQATALCAGAINGQTGWRLPAQAELSALYASGALAGQGDWTLDGTWSSTPNGAGAHYFVLLNIGFVDWNFDTASNYVTCVR